MSTRQVTKLILLTRRIISTAQRRDLTGDKIRSEVYRELKELSDASWVSFGIGIVCGLAIAAVVAVLRGH